MENKHEMYSENKKITSEHSVKLLGIEIYNQLSFDNHVSTLCKKATSQLNAIGRLREYIGFPKRTCKTFFVYVLYPQDDQIIQPL